MRPASSSVGDSSGRGLVDLPREGEPLRAENEAMRNVEGDRASVDAAAGTGLYHLITKTVNGGACRDDGRYVVQCWIDVGQLSRMQGCAETSFTPRARACACRISA